MEEDENFKLTAAKLKEMGQKKMTREERKRRQRALSNLDIPNFETFWKVKRAENVEGVGEYIWTCLSKIIVHHYISTITIYFFCGNCPDQLKYVRGLSKLVWAIKGAHIFNCPCTRNTCIHWAVDHLFQQFTKKKKTLMEQIFILLLIKTIMQKILVVCLILRWN